MVKIHLSLTRKIIGTLLLVLITAFYLSYYAGRNVIRQFFVENALDNAISATKLEGQWIERFFKERERVGLRSVRFVKNLLSEDKISRQGLDGFDSRYRVIDGAVRTDLGAFPDKDVSAVFLSNLVPLDDEIKKIILLTENGFDDYAKGVMGTVYNMYLITWHQLLRTYEKDWAVEIEASHDFNSDFSFYSGDPRHDRAKKPVWTPAYYNSIWGHWMTSVIVPMYMGTKFFGVVGHDVILDDIYNRVLNKRYFRTGYGFIFDSDENIIVHPGYLEKLVQKADMGEYLNFKELKEKGLKEAITAVIKDRYSKPVLFSRNGGNYYLITYQINFLNWYFGMVIPEMEILKFMPEMMRTFLLLAVFIAGFLMIALPLIVWLLVLRPLKIVISGIKELGRGNLGYRTGYRSGDEMGTLSDSFDRMAASLKQESDKRMKMEKEIIDKNLEMESFLYTVSHDLKSPLFAIQGFINLVLEELKGTLSEKSTHYFERMRSNIRKMNKLINDLLELSRIGRITGEAADIDMRSFFGDIKEALKEIMKAKNIDLTVKVSGKGVFRADPNRVKQIFDNLIGNAIKYIGPGKNKRIELSSDDVGPDVIRFGVKDNGIGIDPKFHEKIFEVFFRVGKESGAEEGTGVGLTSVKKIVENMGGRIWLKSALGEGSEFFIEVPLGAGQKAVSS
ncbi:MAG: sensor histidine kinase [Candidatus Omnitrophica bacterium]|nr:sensor histidine kinase [Candidatus Omnitrophota bacterium]